MEDEEDVVVEEIPVFLSKNLENNLFLFQYPNKTAPIDADVVNCCVKPISHEVKVDFAIDTESKHYDSFKGKQFAVAADGKGKDTKNDRASFQSGTMDKQSFIGKKQIENVDNYCIGLYQDKEIHLSPLANIFQMHQTFSYFDKEDKRNKSEQKAANENDEDEELQQVTVKFSRNETERLKGKARTELAASKSVSDEPWCETLWHPRTSPTSEIEKLKLLANTREPIEHTLSLSAKKYIEQLIPQERSDQSLETILPSKIVSKSKLKNLNLSDQLKNILKDGKMMTFIDIMSILEECNNNLTTEKVLRTLPLVGIVLHGNWVAQSEILYTAESLSNANGVPSELMIKGRDYVLYKFSKQDYLHRRKVIISTQLPPEEATEILQSIARLNSEKKWELLLPPDVNFESRYTDIVQRQEMVWRATEQIFLEMDFEKSPKRARKKSIREVKNEKS